MLYYIHNITNDLIGFRYNDNIYYYIKNAQNDIIGILDLYYNIVAKYKYDAWGNIVSILDGNNTDVSNNLSHIANINPFRYRSYYYDQETKLYYLNSRYYNPLWGRFINGDGIIGSNDDVISYNLYVYCSNNPINNSDLLGNNIFTDMWNGIKKLGANILNRINNIGKAGTKAVEKAFNSIVNIGKETIDNFVAEGGCGKGVGASFSLGKLDTGIDAYQDVTYGIKDKQVYSNISVEKAINIFGFGVSSSFEHPYPFPSDTTYFKYDPLNYKMLKSSKYSTSSFSLNTPISSTRTDGIFIGVAVNIHLGYGCHAKVWWDIEW